MHQDNHFLRKQYLKLLFPLMFSVLGGTINTLIDSILVAAAVGNNGLAAVNTCLPVYLVMCTAGSLIAGGAWILSSQSIGKEQVEQANRIYHKGLVLAFLVALVITIDGVWLNSEIALILSSNGAIYEEVRQYNLISLIGALPCIMMYFPMNYLQLEGKGKQISTMIMLMIGTDVVLDALFLFPFQWGMYGAAAASVLANLVSCIYGFAVLHGKDTNFPFRIEYLQIGQVGAIIKNGSALALGNFYDAVRLLLVNSIILRFYGAPAMSIWAILNTISELALIIASGVPGAASSMHGVYYTARENSRIRLLVGLEVRVGTLLSAGFCLLIVVLNRPIQLLFNADQSLLVPLLCLGVANWFQLLSGIWSELLQATQKIWIANVQVCLRRLLLPVLILLILAKQHQYLWLFMPVSAVLTLVISVLVVGCVSLYSRTTKRPLSGVLLLDDYLQREHKVIDFSVEANTDQACEASERIADFCMQNNMNTRQMMKVQLAIEELLCILISQTQDIKEVDARAYAFDDIIGVQFRYAGIKYNPFEDTSEEVALELRLINKIGEEFRHNYTLGMNTINFCISTMEDAVNGGTIDE